MKASKKRKIGIVLLAVGIALIATVGIYSATQYPWGYLRHKVFGSEVKIPADPAPLWVPYTFPGENTQPQEIEALPGDYSDVFRKRPILALTMLGTIKIPILEVSENVVEGVGDEMLYGVGHIPGTAYPGQEGNSVLCAHRDYLLMNPFNHLSKLQSGDTVLLADTENQYTYEVYENFSVKPDEVWVVDPVEGETHLLTMITCSPTYSHREIVRARLVSTEPLE